MGFVPLTMFKRCFPEILCSNGRVENDFLLFNFYNKEPKLFSNNTNTILAIMIIVVVKIILTTKTTINNQLFISCPIRHVSAFNVI